MRWSQAQSGRHTSYQLMAVALKRKRKIVVNDQFFYWYVGPCEDWLYTCLCVLSPDKKFLVHYHLNQSESYQIVGPENWLPSFVTVLGNLGGLSASGSWRRVRTPIWQQDSIITPAFVRQLIEWCLDENKQIILVDWKGETI